MLTHYGVIPYPVLDLVREVQFIMDWTFRVDPESDKTCVVREGHPEFPKGLKDLIQVATETYLKPGYQNRIVLSCVPAGAEILPHTDDFGEEVRKASIHCHIPLISHPSVIMGGKTEVHMQVGHLYSMDETQRHYVKNPSDVDRIHLLFAHFFH